MTTIIKHPPARSWPVLNSHAHATCSMEARVKPNDEKKAFSHQSSHHITIKETYYYSFVRGDNDDAREFRSNIHPHPVVPGATATVSRLQVWFFLLPVVIFLLPTQKWLSVSQRGLRWWTGCGSSGSKMPFTARRPQAPRRENCWMTVVDHTHIKISFH